MKIAFKRSGGFAGMRLSLSLDTQALSEQDAHLLEDLVATTDFFDLPPVLPSPPGSVDRFQYEIVVETFEQRHAVDAGEGALPDSLRPLVDQLTQMVRSAQRNG